MPLMLAKTYAAFKAAGVSDSDAQAAAGELANYENRLNSLDNRLGQLAVELSGFREEVRHRFAEVKNRFTVLTWAIGINAAATIAVLGILLRR
jgi:hypothetical protein